MVFRWSKYGASSIGLQLPLISIEGQCDNSDAQENLSFIPSSLKEGSCPYAEDVHFVFLSTESLRGSAETN